MNRQGQNRPLTIAVVGDVHDQWESTDSEALEALGVDLALFVGDFGNEAVGVVQAIAALAIPKAAILGNHDAWYTATGWGRQKCPYDRTREDRVQQQLDLLGPAHVGYGKRDFSALNITVVGSRPFSWGGPEWKHADFYRDRYGVHSFEESTAKMVAAALAATGDVLIFLGHCGPTGLGDRPEDPCGRDWRPLGGDYGDPDLAAAIAATRRLGKFVPLVTFGHMHHRLRHTKARSRRSVHVDAEGTVYLNAASVPRIVETERGDLRNFSLVTLEAGMVTQASLVWVDPAFDIISETVLYRHSSPVVELV